MNNKIKKLTSLSKLLLLGTLLISLISLLTACSIDIKSSSDSSKRKPKIVLNERQKSILAELGQSEEYDELSLSAKEGIVAIEEMLQAMDNKYGKEFAYSGYIADGVLEKETLYAYEKDGDPSTDSFEVHRYKKDGKAVYSDSYPSVATRPLYEDYINDFFEDLDVDGEYYSKTKVYDSNVKDLTTSKKDIEGLIFGETYVYLSGITSEEQFLDICSNYNTWLKERKLYGDYVVIVVKSMKKITVGEIAFPDRESENFLYRHTFEVEPD